MAEPVKTAIMDAIGSVLAGISGIKTVRRGQAIPTDAERTAYPWLCYFDETETKTARNRVAWKEFDLVVQVWVEESGSFSSLDAQLEHWDACVEAAILTDEGVAGVTLRIEPTSSEKFYIEDGRAILQTIFRIIYCHEWKNPFQTDGGS